MGETIDGLIIAGSLEAAPGRVRWAVDLLAPRAQEIGTLVFSLPEGSNPSKVLEQFGAIGLTWVEAQQLDSVPALVASKS